MFSATAMNFFLLNFSAVLFLCVVPIFSSYDTTDETRENPRVLLVSGKNISCSESASVLLEYEVWHIDPQEAVTVSMFLSHIHETEGYAYYKQRLIEAGGLPSGELMLSRLREGRYLIELELVRRNMDETSIIAIGNSTLGKTKLMSSSLSASRLLTLRSLQLSRKATLAT